MNETRIMQPLRDTSELSSNCSISPRDVLARMECSDRGIQIGAANYGEKTAKLGCGYPILLEFHDGKLILRVWADINSEEPTHFIDLEGACEDAREEEVE